MDPNYEVAYHVVQVMGIQLKLIDESGKRLKVSVQDVKITNLVDTLLKCIPDKKAFGVHQSIKHIPDLWMTYSDQQIQLYYQTMKATKQFL